MSVYRLETLFPEQIQTRLEACPLLVLPFGTIEWHSYHLPLGLDGLVAHGLAERVAEGLDAVLAPVSYWAAGGVPYPYTLNLPGSLIEPLLETVFEQFAAMGFRVIVGLTGHFGLEQTLVLKRAAVGVMRRSPATILPLAEYDLTTDIGYSGDHAATGETSLLWALRPELVRLDAVPADARLDGVLGADPRGTASAELGQSLLEQIAGRTSELADRLLRRTSAVERAAYVEALAAGVRVLERMSQERATRPKRMVPALTTPAYLAHCQAIFRGDYHVAQAEAERKLSNLTS
jgi:creatinine amidohydrolase